jgi:hypothetical protein
VRTDERLGGIKSSDSNDFCGLKLQGDIALERNLGFTNLYLIHLLVPSPQPRSSTQHRKGLQVK